MVDPRDRDGADDPEAGGGSEGATGSDAPDEEETAFGSSDWFYHQLSGGRRRAREAEAAASADDADEDGAEGDDNPTEPVAPPTPAVPPTQAFEPPATRSILDVPVTSAEPPEPVFHAEPKPQTGPIFEPGAPFVWGLKPGVGSDPLVEPPEAGSQPPASAAEPAGEPEPSAPRLPGLLVPISPAPAAPPSLVPAADQTPAPDEFAPPTRAFQPPAFDLPSEPTAPTAPETTAPETTAQETTAPETPAPEFPTKTPGPWSPAPLLPPASLVPPGLPEPPSELVAPPFPAEPEQPAAGATPAHDEVDGEGHGLAALLGMFEESEPETRASEAPGDATGAEVESPAPEPAESVPPMAPAFFEPAPLVPPSFAVPVVPIVPPAPPTVPVEAPRFLAVPGLVPPPVGASGAEPPLGAAPLGAAQLGAAQDATPDFDEDADDEGIDDIAAPPYDEAAARAAAADTATVLMDAAAIEAVRADATEPAEEATLLMGGIPSPATQALDAESLADASAPTVAMAPASAAAAAAAAGPDDVLPPTRRSRGATPPGATPPGGRPPGSRDGTNRILFWVAGGLVAVLILIALFVFGTRLPSMFTAGTPTPTAVQTKKATPTPTPTPKPTVIAKPGAPQPAGVSKWSTLGGGECIQPFTTPWAETFTIVDCATPHAAQMVYTNLFSADPAAPYPGAPALANQINLLCTKAGVINLQAASAYPDLQLQGTYPATPQQWADGLRSYYCFASRSSGQPITGSVAGPGPQG